MKLFLYLRRGWVACIITLVLACLSASASTEFRIYKSETFYLTDAFPRDLLLAEGLKMKAIDRAVAQCRVDEKTLCEVKSSNLIFERNLLASRAKAIALVHGLSAPQLQSQQKYTSVRNFYQAKVLEPEELQGIRKIALESAMSECQQVYLFCGFESTELTQQNTLQPADTTRNVYVSTAKATVVGYPPEESSYFSTEPPPEELE